MKLCSTNLNKGTRAVGYLRVSDTSQIEGYSLDAQKAEIQRWCERRGHELVRYYADEGFTAHTDKISKRPQLVRLLDDAKHGSFDTVVAHTLDRWARNVGVQRQTLQQLGECNVGFASVMEDIDFTTPSGRLLLTTMGGVAEFFSDQLGLHVQKAQKQMAESGITVGPLPFGYSPQEKGLPPTKNPTEAEAVLESFQLRIEGYSYGEVAAWINTHGFRTKEGNAFTPHAVKDMLNNRFYCGCVKYQGKEYHGKHEATISEELFQQVQARRHPKDILRTVHGPKGLVQGMVACAYCGRTLQSDRHRQQVPIYRERHAHECCTNNTSIVAEVIDKQVAAIVHFLELHPDWSGRMAELAVVKNNKISPDTLREKRRRLGKAYAEGAFTDDEFHRRLSDIDRQLQQATNTIAPDLKEAVELFSNLPILWNEATTEERRRLIGTLIETVYVDLKIKKVIWIKPTPVFRSLFGTGITNSPNTPVGLIPAKEVNSEHVGVGGDGGGASSFQAAY